MSKVGEKSIAGFNDSYPVQIGYYDLEREIKSLAGKILTFVDMAVVDKQSNKAWKDNIKQEFWKTIGRFQHDCSEGKCGQSVSFDVHPDSELR